MSHDLRRDQWRQQIQSARQRLDFARAFVEEVERDMEAGTIAQAHTFEAYNRALSAEILALQEYARVLESFKEHALRTEIPRGNETGVNRNSADVENEPGMSE